MAENEWENFGGEDVDVLRDAAQVWRIGEGRGTSIFSGSDALIDKAPASVILISLHVAGCCEPIDHVLCDIKHQRLEYFGHVFYGEKYHLLPLEKDEGMRQRLRVDADRTEDFMNLRDWYVKDSLFLCPSKVEVAVSDRVFKVKEGSTFQSLSVSIRYVEFVQP